jgi:hypothetical protein
MRKVALLGRDKRTFLDMLYRQKKYLILCHGITTLGTFKVPDDMTIVFISEPGEKLPQRVVDRKFYDIFANPAYESRYYDYDNKKTKTLLQRFGEWAERVYLPGSECPDLNLNPNDPAWPGMGLHALPLQGFLARHPAHHENTIVDPEGLANELRARYGTFKNDVVRGNLIPLKSAKSKPLLSEVNIPGVVFIAACREPTAAPGTGKIQQKRQERNVEIAKATEMNLLRKQRMELAQIKAMDINVAKTKRRRENNAGPSPKRQRSPNVVLMNVNKPKKPKNIADLFRMLSIGRTQNATRLAQKLDARKKI